MMFEIGETLGVLIGMALLGYLWCLCMKLSDVKLKLYLVELAKKKGLDVDEDNLDLKNNCQSPHANENCTIVMPEVGIVL